MCDGNGTPIYVLTSGANVPDIKRARDLLDCYPPIAGRPGRPRRRFAALLAVKASRSAAFRQACHEHGAPSRSSPSPGRTGSKAWASCATSSSRPSLCCTSSADLPCAGNAASTSTTACQPCLRPNLLAPTDQLDPLRDRVRPLSRAWSARRSCRLAFRIRAGCGRRWT
ncbi:hypothetical protein AB0J80_36710 [Actinoplanes sp. NPDC049548]|uniref:hypothetical protein n=1 Tax=Actinoplanes sp. NPDC049548 TaxID=3155152 RepID=UPI003440556B